MAGRIRILDDHVINRIAAGEVVERPASVVKELVENAVDAEATRIDVELETGGRRLIRVSDDGSGMEEDEALLALERHATSKLEKASDLERISTLGFRGEALPSIAAVSRMRLSTSVDPSAGGCLIIIEGGRILGVEGLARHRGTTIEVRDLFFNTPARRKFLHAPETELRHVQEALTAMAMARPEIGLRLRHSGRVLIEAPATHDEEQRFRDLLRRKKVERIRSFEAESGEYRARGLLAETSGSGRPRVSLLVNGRWVRDRLMVAAVFRVLREAGRGFGGAHIMLALSLPADAVDVNVHPAKAEVRFARSGTVFALIERGLRGLFEAGHGSIPLERIEHVREAPSMPSGTGMRWRSEPSFEAVPRKEAEAERLFPDPSDSGKLQEVATSRTPPYPSSSFPSASPVRPSGARARAADTSFGKLLAQYRNSFLLLEDDAGLVIIDQHVAHERVLYETFLERLSSRSAPSNGLLIPILVELEESRVAALPRVAGLLEGVGIDAEVFGPETIRITSLPPEFNGEDAAGLLEEMLDRATDLDGTPERVAEELREEMAASLACRAAIKINHPLKDEEQRALLEDLSKTRDPYRCPHGRPIVLRLLQDEMERRLGRR